MRGAATLGYHERTHKRYRDELIPTPGENVSPDNVTFSPEGLW